MSSSMSKKLSKGQNIELNWKCNVQKSVPAEIRPRASLNRSKALIGTSVPEAQWQNWSLNVLSELGKLSSMTAGKLAFAQELMLLEVKQRQQDASSHLQSVAEILLGDLERINRDLMQSRMEGSLRHDANEEDASDGDASDNEDDDGDDDIEDEDRYNNDGEHEDRGDEHNAAEEADDPHLDNDGTGQPTLTENGSSQQKDTDADVDQQGIKVETHETDLNMKLTSKYKEVIPRSQSVQGNGISKASSRTKAVAQTAKTKKVLKDKAKIASLFAEAMRLKQEAAKREAEAYELEAKMLVAEAKHLD